MSTDVATEPCALRLGTTSPAALWVEDDAGLRTAIHPIWLRERCQDPGSIDLKTGQRLDDPSDLDLDLRLEAVSEMPNGCLRVRFSDGHEADFAAADILAEASLGPDEHDLPGPHLWTGELSELPRATWQANAAEPERAAWLDTFLRYGFIIFSGVPASHHAVLEVARTFGYPRETNFGMVFDVRSVPDATDLAYTAMHLDPHTDNPYRSPVPGVQLLHCLVNETSGGASTLVDGYAVAERLRKSDPDAFKVLTTTAVRFRYRDAATELTASAPPIELDLNGRVRTIHFSPRLDFVPLQPLEELSAYYRARKKFDQLLRSTEFGIRFLLNSGDLVMFDNCRLLHGRTGFDPRQGLRHLQGCYIDIDGPRSSYRVWRGGALKIEGFS